MLRNGGRARATVGRQRVTRARRGLSSSSIDHWLKLSAGERENDEEDVATGGAHARDVLARTVAGAESRDFVA
ncbi:hypothetical protein JTB14_031117 [Gonioctena quinquepunctata]|nr:hypothetical protein JTB14_031117 [Gonioctena quinquepunctata]